MVFVAVRQVNTVSMRTSRQSFDFAEQQRLRAVATAEFIDFIVRFVPKWNDSEINILLHAPSDPRPTPDLGIAMADKSPTIDMNIQNTQNIVFVLLCAGACA